MSPILFTIVFTLWALLVFLVVVAFYVGNDYYAYFQFSANVERVSKFFPLAGVKLKKLIPNR